MIRLGEPDDPVAPALAPDGGPPVDALLAELGRAGGEAGPDFLATILAEQDELIRTPPDSLLLIQGGPGTGKTTTALRRVAALLTDPGLGLSPADVLVLGPSRAFAARSRAVLDGWGHRGVEHRSAAGLLPAVEGGRLEAPYVTRLKGEARMAGLIERALPARPQAPTGDLPTSIMVGGRDVVLDQVALRRVVATARASEAGPGDRRRILRAVLAAASPDPRRVLEAADLLAERLWPSFDACAFLAGLFASRERLTEAAGGEFTDREITALYRPAAGDPAGETFSDADLALLDEAEHRAGEQPARFRHVLVDEAQDLSPMQLRAVSRRSANGSLTVVGDMAQSTGPWARDDWHDVLAHLPAEMPHVHRELRFGYRVPRQIFDLAAELLPTAAPSVQPPTTVREGPADPVVAPVDPARRAAVVVAAAAEHAADGRSVAIICPARCRDEIEALLNAEHVPWRTAAGGRAGQPGADPGAEPGGAGHGRERDDVAITLLSAHETKGLEFDAAVVVEPGFIVDDDPRGHRLLYIALTRATSHLHLVGAPEDLPIEYAMEAPRHLAAEPPRHLAEESPRQGSGEPSDPLPEQPSAGLPGNASAHLSGAASTRLSEEPSSRPAGEPGVADDALTEQPHPAPAPAAAPPEPEIPLDPAVRESIDVVAHALAETLLANLTPELWPAALDRLIELISPDD